MNPMKMSIVLLVALAVTALLRRRSAALRHWVLAAGIACAAATPLLEIVVPAWGVPRPEPSTASLALEEWPADQAAAVPRVNPDLTLTARAALLIGPVWLIGATISLGLLAAGIARLSWLTSRARRVDHGTWADLSAAIAGEYRLRRPVLLLESRHPTLLVTWGFRRPKVILPAATREWADDRARVVLSHELAHIRRGDWAVQMAAELIRCVYWFNPLLWIACRRLRDESEQACDDAVLNRGVGATDYATHLLDVARASAQRRTLLSTSPALAMARRPTLERRITAMLNARLARTPITRSACVATVAAFLAVTIPISGFGRAAQNAAATFSGTLVDTVGRVLSDVPMTLTNTGTTSKHDARSDQAGHFTFTGLAAGTYELDARIPGFAARYRLTLGAGQTVQRDVALQLGSIQETITVRGGASPGMPPAVRRARAAAEPDYSCGPSSVGGCIDMPIKRKDVKPVYPPHLDAARREGIVLLEGYIGVDGLLNGLRVVAPVDPDFANAALDAVRQWEFRPTRLDGVTVETRITITVNFQAGN